MPTTSAASVGENLRKARDWLPTARELLKVKRDLELPVGVADLAHAQPDKPRLAQLFEHLDFQGWRRELGEVPAAGRRRAPSASTRRS